MFQCSIYHVSTTTRDRLQCAQDITASLFKILTVACNMIHQNSFRFCMSAYQIPKQIRHFGQHIYWKDILHLGLSKSWNGFYTLVNHNNERFYILVYHNTDKRYCILDYQIIVTNDLCLVYSKWKKTYHLSLLLPCYFHHSIKVATGTDCNTQFFQLCICCSYNLFALAFHNAKQMLCWVLNLFLHHKMQCIYT